MNILFNVHDSHGVRKQHLVIALFLHVLIMSKKRNGYFYKTSTLGMSMKSVNAKTPGSLDPHETYKRASVCSTEQFLQYLSLQSDIFKYNN